VRSSSNGPVLAILGLAIWSAPATAADNTAALRCGAIAAADARLACYDALFRTSEGAAVPQATAAAAAAAATAATAHPQPAANPVADFGLTPVQQRSLDPEKANEPRAPESVTGTVAKIGYKPTGELVVTLENGQVWVQIDTGNKARAKAGDTVTIKRGTFGSYMLVTPNKIATRVRRVK
jgi:hypothetical protein